MRRRLPPLNSLRAFEAVGRHGKLADAADELCVTLGAVSRHISLIEGFAGFQLFTRHRRGFTLTEKGAHYLRTISQAFDQIDSATTNLLGYNDQPRLSVRVFTTFASEWLVPRLSSFFVEHPEIDFRLSSSVTAVNLDTEDVDIGIRREPIAPGLEADLLFYPEYYPVCSPVLLERGPRLNTPLDLQKHPLLNTKGQAVNWRAWLERAGVNNVDFEKGLWFDNASLAFRAAREGVGVALGQRHYLSEDLIAGRLVAPFRSAIRSRRAYHMVYAKRRAKEPHIAAFREWVLAQIAEADKRSALIQDMPTHYSDTI